MICSVAMRTYQDNLVHVDEGANLQKNVLKYFPTIKTKQRMSILVHFSATLNRCLLITVAISHGVTCAE